MLTFKSLLFFGLISFSIDGLAGQPVMVTFFNKHNTQICIQLQPVLPPAIPPTLQLDPNSSKGFMMPSGDFLAQIYYDSASSSCNDYKGSIELRCTNSDFNSCETAEIVSFSGPINCVATVSGGVVSQCITKTAIGGLEVNVN